jgi:hypothetical protein
MEEMTRVEKLLRVALFAEVLALGFLFAVLFFQLCQNADLRAWWTIGGGF